MLKGQPFLKAALKRFIWNKVSDEYRTYTSLSFTPSPSFKTILYYRNGTIYLAFSGRKMVAKE